MAENHIRESAVGLPRLNVLCNVLKQFSGITVNCCYMLNPVAAV